MVKETYNKIKKFFSAPFVYFSYAKKMQALCEQYVYSLTEQLYEENTEFATKVGILEKNVENLQVKLDRITLDFSSEMVQQAAKIQTEYETKLSEKNNIIEGLHTQNQILLTTVENLKSMLEELGVSFE